MGDSRAGATQSLRRLLVMLIIIVSTVVSAPSAGVTEDETPFGPGAVDGEVKPDRIRRDFFGLHINIAPAGAATWPDFMPATVRLDTFWSSIERVPGVYDWTATDVRVAAAEHKGAKPIINLLSTPLFHALDAATASLASPPRLSAYGRFVYALVSRYGARADYQIWNEPSVPVFYTGEADHMARMTKRFASIADRVAPGATVVAPSFPLRVTSNRKWFRRYWNERPGRRRVAAFVDAASISAYPMPDGDPEDGLAITQWARETLTTYGFTGPIWATEINYGANSGHPTKEIPMKRQVSNVVRTYALHGSLGADRVYWWMWTPNHTVNTELQDVHGALTPAGVAFGVVRDWLLGTRPTGCSSVRGVTTCGFRVNRELERHVSWNRWGRTRTMIASPGARTRTDPAGVTTMITPGTKIRVGVTPVMVEVRRRR